MIRVWWQVKLIHLLHSAHIALEMYKSIYTNSRYCTLLHFALSVEPASRAGWA